MRRVIAAVICLMLVAALVVAQTPNVVVTYRTTRPTTGSVPVKFLWELKTDGGAFAPYVTTTDTLATFTLAHNHVYVVRVKAEDAAGFQGDYSPVSDAYNPTKPGACGKPTRLP